MGEEQEKAAAGRHDAVRAAVRDALPGLLHEKTFKDLTIDEIARAAGLTRTAFYFYFKNKSEVLSAAVEEVAAAMYDATEQWWQGQGPPEQSVREALEGTAHVYHEHADMLRVAIEVTSYDPAFAQLYRSLTERFITTSTAHVRREQEAGRARPGDPERIVEALVWMTERCCHQLICVDGRNPGDVVDALTPIWLHALYTDSDLEA